MDSISGQLDILKSLAIGISKQFGEKCEVIMHDYSRPFESSIIFIVNGHVTGREVGQSGTELGLKVYQGEILEEGKYNYITRTPNGKILRSSTTYIKNDSNTIVGSMCINYDITDLVVANQTLDRFVNFQEFDSKEEDKPESDNVIYNQVDDLLSSLIDDSIKHIGVPVAKMTRDQKIEGIHYLEKTGAFLIKKAAQLVGDVYGVSKYTIYNYLNKTVS